MEQKSSKSSILKERFKNFGKVEMKVLTSLTDFHKNFNSTHYSPIHQDNNNESDFINIYNGNVSAGAKTYDQIENINIFDNYTNSQNQNEITNNNARSFKKLNKHYSDHTKENSAQSEVFKINLVEKSKKEKLSEKYDSDNEILSGDNNNDLSDIKNSSNNQGFYEDAELDIDCNIEEIHDDESPNHLFNRNDRLKSIDEKDESKEEDNSSKCSKELSSEIIILNNDADFEKNHSGAKLIIQNNNIKNINLNELPKPKCQFLDLKDFQKKNKLEIEIESSSKECLSSRVNKKDGSPKNGSFLKQNLAKSNKFSELDELQTENKSQKKILTTVISSPQAQSLQAQNLSHEKNYLGSNSSYYLINIKEIQKNKSLNNLKQSPPITKSNGFKKSNNDSPSKEISFPISKNYSEKLLVNSSLNKVFSSSAKEGNNKFMDMKKRLKDDIILLDKMIEDEYKENKKKFKRNKKSLSYEEAKLNDFLEKKSLIESIENQKQIIHNIVNYNKSNSNNTSQNLKLKSPDLNSTAKSINGKEKSKPFSHKKVDIKCISSTRSPIKKIPAESGTKNPNSKSLLHHMKEDLNKSPSFFHEKNSSSTIPTKTPKKIVNLINITRTAERKHSNNNLFDQQKSEKKKTAKEFSKEIQEIYGLISNLEYLSKKHNKV